MPTDSETEEFLKRPLADIIDEVKRLRAENASLTAANNALQRKAAAQRILPDLYASQLAETKDLLINAIQHSGLQLPSLPPEVLLSVFSFTQPERPPYHHHPPSVYRGPRNPWLDSLSTKKALVLVCKAWSPPATELLYAGIVLRRMGQISALANTLRENHNLASLVRAVRMDMCVVLTHCTEVVREDFEYILTQCTMLHTFVFLHHPQFSFQAYDFACGAVPTSPTAFNPTWILDLRQGRAGSLLARSISSRIVALHLDLTTYEDSFLPLSRLLSSTPFLTSLELGSLSSPPDDPPSGLPQPLPDLSFPALRTLSIYCDLIPFVRYVTTQWTMPHLASLTCIASHRIPTALLGAHGRQLTYLYFMYDEPRDLLANIDLLPRLHELCPLILHLALFLPAYERTALDIHSHTLRYLDICARPSVAAYRAISLAPTSRAPQMKKIRMVSDMHPFVPQYFHPSHMPGSDAVLEDVSHLPGAQQSDAFADWLACTSGGVEAVFPEWRMRQHPWAVVTDPSGIGIPAGRFPPSGKAAEADGEGLDGEYEYESVPSSPADSDSDTPGGEAGDEYEDDEAGQSDAGSDSDMWGAWIKVRESIPPIPSRAVVAFVDGLLDSSGRKYDRETVLERFSRSQLGDFLLD